MYFTRIRLKNFGPFSDADFRFEPHAINWLVGDNGAGKTQLAGAIVAAIVGRPAISITEGGVGPTEIELTMEERGTTELARLVVAENSHGKLEVSKTTGPLVLQILAAMSDSSGQRLLVGSGQEFGNDSSRLRDIEKILPDALKDDPAWVELRQSGVLEGSIGSGGQRSLLEFVWQFAVSQRAQFKLPLMVDEWAWRWPQDLLPFVCRLLELIARESQVIVLGPAGRDMGRGPMQVISAPRGHTSLAGYNQLYGTRRPNLGRPPQSKWVRGAKYHKQESRACEFKEVKGGNPLGAIKGVVDQYAVAFLNAGVPQEGAIFWGIRDEDRAIVGVQLRQRECDELRRIVTERLHQIVPPIAPTAYRIDLHPVSDGAVPINDLYVVEVRIPSIRRTLLFSTGGQEVYVKTDAGKRKLSALELQQELIRRLGVDPDF